MMMRKIFITLLIIGFVYLLPLNVCATEIASGDCGETVTYSVTDEGILYINGTGDITSTPWETYNSAIKRIVIEEGITKISGFKGCAITQIEIPDSVTYIGGRAFSGCKSLEEVIFPDNLEFIDSDAFKECKKLKRIELPEGVNVGPYAFRECESLEKVYASGFLGNGAFYDCELLSDVVLSNVTDINFKTFYGCKNLKQFDFSNIRNIGDYAFCLTGLSTIEFSDTIKSIGEGAFEQCYYLENVIMSEDILDIIGNGGTYYDEGTRLSCAKAFELTPFRMKYEIKKSGNLGGASGEMFWSVDENFHLTLTGSGTAYQMVLEPKELKYMVKSATVDTGITQLIRTFSGFERLEAINLPEGVLSILDETFYSCENLTEIVIPNQVTKIGMNAFENCSNLKRVELSSSLTSLGMYAFRNCNNLEDVELPETITDIAAHAFEGTAIKSIEIPDNIEKIDACTFSDCRELETVKVCGNLRYINTQAFENCTKLKNVWLCEISHIFDDAFAGCEQLEEISMYCGSSALSYNIEDLPIVKRHKRWGYESNDDVTCASAGTKTKYCLTCGEKAETITDENAPATGKHLYDVGTVTLEPTYENEGEKIFSCTVCGKTNIEKIPVKENPNKNDENNNADKDNPQQPTTGLPDKTNVDNSTNTFPVTKGTVLSVNTCDYIVASIDVTAPTVIYKKNKNKNAKTVSVADTITIKGITYKIIEISPNAFKNNKKLARVTIGSNVTKIGSSAFAGCKNLKNITIKSKKLNSVGKNAIKGISKNATIKMPKKMRASYKKLFHKKTGFKNTMKIK